MKSLLTGPALGALEQAVRAAAEDLAAYVQAEGFAELELLDAPRDSYGWAEAGCSWAASRYAYSRRERALVLARLRKGRPSPQWDIREEGQLILCTHRNFTWRTSSFAA